MPQDNSMEETPEFIVDVEDEDDYDENYFDDDDRCYECGGYGDDYYYDAEKDELVSACENCPFNPSRDEWEDY